MANIDKTQQARLVSQDLFAGLPQPIKRYLEYTGVVGTPWIETVYLKQTGRFRQGFDRPWMPMSAEQWYTTNPPGFVWKARFKLAGLPLLRAEDKYQAGKGHMYGKLAGIITVFDQRGEQLDQGSMLRYLSEMIWFPTAFLGENITWKELDNNSAQVTLTDQGRSVSGQIFVDEAGKFTNFTAQRYREVSGDFSLDPWSTPVQEYGVRAGLNLPIKGKAVWNLPEGDLDYVDLDINEIEFNTST